MPLASGIEPDELETMLTAKFSLTHVPAATPKLCSESLNPRTKTTECFINMGHSRRSFTQHLGSAVNTKFPINTIFMTANH